MGRSKVRARADERTNYLAKSNGKINFPRDLADDALRVRKAFSAAFAAPAPVRS